MSPNMLTALVHPYNNVAAETEAEKQSLDRIYLFSKNLYIPMEKWEINANHIPFLF